MLINKYFRYISLLVCLWLFSAVAFSNGSMAPDMAVLNEERNSQEYKVLQDLHNISLELQMLEMAIKGRRNQRIEAKMSEAISFIKKRGTSLENQFTALRHRQSVMISDIVQFARRYAAAAQVNSTQFDSVIERLQNGTIHDGALRVNCAATGVDYAILHLTALRVGSQFVWRVTLPEPGASSFWTRAKTRRLVYGIRAGVLANDNLRQRLQPINEIFEEAREQAHLYNDESHNRLYVAFEDQRFGLFQRLEAARRALTTLERSRTSMGAPEASGALFNKVLEQLYTYGVDVSLPSYEQRAFYVQGFLLAPDPAEANRIYHRMLYVPHHEGSSYNSPSS